MIVGGNMIVHITNDQGRKGDCKYIGNKCKNFLVTCSLLFLYTIELMYNSTVQLPDHLHYISLSNSLLSLDSSFDSFRHYLKKFVWRKDLVGLNFQPWIGAMSARPTSAIVLLNWSCSIFSSNLFLRICARTANAPHMPSEIINNIAEIPVILNIFKTDIKRDLSMGRIKYFDSNLVFWEIGYLGKIPWENWTFKKGTYPKSDAAYVIYRMSYYTCHIICCVPEKKWYCIVISA